MRVAVRLGEMGSGELGGVEGGEAAVGMCYMRERKKSGFLFKSYTLLWFLL